MRADKQPYITYYLMVLTIAFSHLTMATDNATISAQEAYVLSSDNAIVLIDIRSAEEWAKTGVAPDAQLLTIHRRGGLESFKEALMTLLDGNKDQQIALICAGGVRSSRVQHYLQQQGFTQVVDVNEGMLGSFLKKGWIDQGLPVKPYKNK